MIRSQENRGHYEKEAVLSADCIETCGLSCMAFLERSQLRSAKVFLSYKVPIEKLSC